MLADRVRMSSSGKEEVLREFFSEGTIIHQEEGFLVYETGFSYYGLFEEVDYAFEWVSFVITPHDIDRMDVGVSVPYIENDLGYNLEDDFGFYIEYDDGLYYGGVEISRTNFEEEMRPIKILFELNFEPEHPTFDFDIEVRYSDDFAISYDLKPSYVNTIKYDFVNGVII